MTTTHTIIRNHSRVMIIRSLLVLFLAVALLSMNLKSGRVIAGTSEPQSTVVLQTTNVPMLIGTSRVVSNALGNQSDPHIDGNLVSYTDDNLMGANTVRYFDLSTNTDHLVPGNGADSESEVNAGRIVFTESTAEGSQVVLFDIATQTRIVVPGYGFSKPTLGGLHLLFEDRSSTNPTRSDIGGYSFLSNSYFRQTNDEQPDTNPIISQAGNAMLFQKCHAPDVGCIFQGFVVVQPGDFPVFSIPDCPGASQYDVSNDYVLAYTSDKDGETDIYIQQILGVHSETHLVIPGEQRNVSISGNLVSFESPVQLGNVLEYDIFVYDINTGRLYQVTKTPADETLSDISISDGFARIVYAAPTASTNEDVLAFTFRVPGPTTDQINDCSALVDSFQLPAGTGNSLSSKLQDALAAMAASDTATACASLTAFINAAQAQSGKKLTVDQATQLINAATLIKLNLGCQ